MEGHYVELARKVGFTGVFTTAHVRGGGAGGVLLMVSITALPFSLNMALYFVERVSGVAARVYFVGFAGAAPFAVGFGPHSGAPGGAYDYFGMECIMPYEWYLELTTDGASDYVISAEVYD